MPAQSEDAMRSILVIPALLVYLLLAACVSKPTAPQDTSSPESPAPQSSSGPEALIPDYEQALLAHPDDYIAFMHAWLGDVIPDLESPQFVRYVLSGDDRSTQAGAEQLLAGNRAFCLANTGEVVPEPPAFTCAGADRKAIARLSVSVFHSSADQPATLQFTAESAGWLTRLTEERMGDFRRVVDTLAGNGVAGDVLLSTGEDFEVVRFGRLSAPDFYALKTPNHGLIWFTDLVSAKWSEQGLSVIERDGDAFVESGEGLTPGNTIVRLRPTLDNQLKVEPLTAEEPFRFVYWNAATKQPRQARVRADGRILQITISTKAGRYRSGAIQTRFDKDQQEVFRKTLVSDARKTAANTGKRSDRLNLDDVKLRSDLDQVGRVGPCTRTQSEDRLRTGDVSLSEYLVCAQYRQEAETIKGNGGELTPDKTPLLFLGRAARAPWYDFNGVLR
jgi:hypothetical protein